MRAALVYDYLNEYGGGERLLGIVAGMFPGAPIYALMCDRERMRERFPGHEIVTSPFDCAFARRNHRALIPLLPFMAATVRVPDEYDTVITLSASYGKGIRHGRHARHLLYCFTPLRYAWEPDFISSKFSHQAGIPFNRDGSGLVRAAAAPFAAYLRAWERRVARRPDRIVTLSHFIAGKIRERYGREAPVVYPPVDSSRFFFDPAVPKGDYFLAAGRLMHYKRFDLVIDAFNMLGLPLKIVGTGGEAARLRSRIRSPKIEMLGFVPDRDLRRLYAGARAFVFPQVEDFGLVGVEAIACGTPVIAFRGGGAAEIVTEGETGIFFDVQSPECLADAVRRFAASEGRFDPARVACGARRFFPEAFSRAFLGQLALIRPIRYIS